VDEEIKKQKIEKIEWPGMGGSEEEGNPSLLIDKLLEIRTELRTQRQWKLSDLIRDKLAAIGVLLEDSAGGSSWRWE